jgi:PleD family two-component response regulator
MIQRAHLAMNWGYLPCRTPRQIVFVVDDDVSVRESLELLIRCEGWRPETFASAQEFLTHPRALAPSCLVLDVSLPGFLRIPLYRAPRLGRFDVGSLFFREIVMLLQGRSPYPL